MFNEITAKEIEDAKLYAHNVLSPRHNTNDEYETPAYVFNPLNEVFGFGYDVCASKENAKCELFYTKEENGLTRPWPSLKPAWCNPPYSQAKAWVMKAYLESLDGVTTVCLLPGRPDTRAWQETIFPHARAIVFMRGRIKFVGCKDPAKFPSALAVFSPGPLSVEQMMALATFGPIVQTVMRQTERGGKA